MTNDARSPRTPTPRSRASLAFAAVALVAAAALAVLALRPGPDPEAAVLEVDDAVATSTPVTVPPLVSTPSTLPPDGPDGAPSTTVAPSHMAELLGERGSAIPEPFVPPVRPVGLRIDEIFVADPVVSVGLDDGELEVPGADEIGWYRYGAAPGHPGATVLAAHVTWNGEYGPFLNLGELEPGDRATVELEDGTERVYEVVERTMYDKDELPPDRIWRTTGDETLVLITCGGDFNPEISRYRQNIVVYAVPVA